jgi:hypothetical protein
MPTQSTNIFATTGDGLDFSSNGETWEIMPGVAVASTLQSGVASNDKDSTLDNFGYIYSGSTGFAGVSYNNDGGTIINEANATIFGFQAGIAIVRGNTETIENFGSIDSVGSGVIFGTDSNFGSELVNQGTVHGYDSGVLSVSINTGPTIINLSEIQSDQYGILIDTSPGLTTIIANEAGGTIQGVVSAIFVNSGAMSLTNHGTIVGNIDCTVVGATDTIINRGKIEGLVELSGDDVFNGAGGTSGTIFAGGGNDRIIAGKGNVHIDVGSGHSTVSGGPGHDQFIFDSGLGGQITKISKFSQSRD